MVSTGSFNSNWQKKKILDSREFQELAFEEVNELIIQKRIGRKLFLADGSILIDFISCSYLGLDLDKRVIQAASNNIQNCGVTFPAARTRAVVQSFAVLEELLNKIFCNSFSTIFSSLHLAHLGCIPLLGSGEIPSFPIEKNGVVFIVDQHAHASIQINRALMQQFGEVEILRLSDLSELENLMKRNVSELKTSIVFADSVGSMGGTLPISRLYSLVDKFKGYLYLDDAHGTSVFGQHGCGYVLESLNHQFPQRLILTSSLSKAFGAVAGVLALPTSADARMVKKYCQTYIFGGPPPLAIIDSAIASAKIHLSKEISELQNKLWENVKYFDEMLGEECINYGIQSPIRGILIGNEFKAINISKKLQGKGFAVTTAMYPTVQKGKSMLRLALSASHEKEEIQKFCQTFKEVVAQHPFFSDNTV